MKPLQLLMPLLLVLGCDSREPPPIDEQSIRPARVFAVTAAAANINHEFVGRVDAAQTVDVSFEVAGKLAELPVREGQTLSTGELIAELDKTDFLLAVRETQVQLRLAQQDLTRKEKLLNEQGISQSIVDDARAQFDLAQVNLQQAQERLADTRIHAPFDAQIARRFTDNHVNVVVGQPIARLSDLSELFIIVNVPERILATVTPDRVVAVNARFAFLPEHEFPLTYRENSGEADAVAQTYEITFTMPTPTEWNILPGMTASVEVELSNGISSHRQIRIPTPALLSDADGQFFVWLFDPESLQVTRRTVEVGPAEGLGIPIRSGLHGGELVVASGATHLQSGMKIRMLGKPTTAL